MLTYWLIGTYIHPLGHNSQSIGERFLGFDALFVSTVDLRKECCLDKRERAISAGCRRWVSYHENGLPRSLISSVISSKQQMTWLRLQAAHENETKTAVPSCHGMIIG